VSGRGGLFVVLALGLLAWTTAVVVLVGPPSAGSSVRLASRASIVRSDVRVASSSGPARLAPLSTATRLAAASAHEVSHHSAPVANNAADPAAAGPRNAKSPAVTRVVLAFAAAYVGWSADPSPGTRGRLRSTSTTGLYGWLVAAPPRPIASVAGPMAISGVAAFVVANGFSATVDLTRAGADLELELLIVRTPGGLRVGRVYL
jgi:hypothetical protein